MEGEPVKNRIDEVTRLRGLLRDVDLYGQGFVYAPAGREPMTLHPADVTVVMRSDAVTAHEAALKVVKAAEDWRDAIRGIEPSATTAGTRLLDAVDEWRSR